MDESGPRYWQDVVEEYASRGEREARAVDAAREQAAEIRYQPEFFETVYTLARERVETESAP
jgi:hypothetical protein